MDRNGCSIGTHILSYKPFFAVTDRGEMSSPWAGASVSAEIFLESSLFLKSSIRFTTLILKDKMS